MSNDFAVAALLHDIGKFWQRTRVEKPFDALYFAVTLMVNFFTGIIIFSQGNEKMHMNYLEIIGIGMVVLGLTTFKLGEYLK